MINKRVIRHNFNMVEIMLAVIIIALGLTSVFVLFPVGLNAARDAVAENHVSDIGETAANHIVQSVILPDAIGTTASAFKPLDTLESSYFCNPEDTAVKNLTDVPIDLNSLDDSNKFNDRDYLHKLANGVFVYVLRQQSTLEALFSAVIKIYFDRNSNSGFEDEYFYTRSGDYQQYSTLKSSTGECINKFLLPVAIEVSWPATVPMEEREKRIFRFEMFNHEYDPGTDADAKP